MSLFFNQLYLNFIYSIIFVELEIKKKNNIYILINFILKV